MAILMTVKGPLLEFRFLEGAQLEVAGSTAASCSRDTFPTLPGAVYVLPGYREIFRNTPGELRTKLFVLGYEASS
jgi:hypothetical protein